MSTIKGAELRAIITQIESLQAERDDAATRILNLYRQARRNGYVVGALRRLVRERKIGREKLEQEQAQVAGLEDLVGDI